MQSQNDRTPPTRIRITGLQEAQLAELVKIDAACSDLYYSIGFDRSEVPHRAEADFAVLTRTNAVHVIEADRKVAGFLVWHDEVPGIVYVVDLQVHPDFQRFGLATMLLDAMRDHAREFKLEQVVVRCWEKASWALGFYRRQRFMPIDATAPAKVRQWKEERLNLGRPLTRPGEVVLWSPIGSAMKIDDEMDMTLLTGELPRDEG